ncbi:hypothetical protein DRN76_04745 [Methanosarcinales archaeon]|nr:MAG: hypothetical protein DRN76_04745 [Methanosarcinales archaeon]
MIKRFLISGRCQCIRKEIKKIQKRWGITTILVTHNLEEAEEMGDRIVAMNGGNIGEVVDLQHDHGCVGYQRIPIIGYNGGINLVDRITNAILEYRDAT